MHAEGCLRDSRKENLEVGKQNVARSQGPSRDSGLSCRSISGGRNTRVHSKGANCSLEGCSSERRAAAMPSPFVGKVSAEQIALYQQIHLH